MKKDTDDINTNADRVTDEGCLSCSSHTERARRFRPAGLRLAADGQQRRRLQGGALPRLLQSRRGRKAASAGPRPARQHSQGLPQVNKRRRRRRRFSKNCPQLKPELLPFRLSVPSAEDFVVSIAPSRSLFELVCLSSTCNADLFPRCQAPNKEIRICFGVASNNPCVYSRCFPYAESLAQVHTAIQAQHKFKQKCAKSYSKRRGRDLNERPVTVIICPVVDRKIYVVLEVKEMLSAGKSLPIRAFGSLQRTYSLSRPVRVWHDIAVIT